MIRFLLVLFLLLNNMVIFSQVQERETIPIEIEREFPLDLNLDISLREYKEKLKKEILDDAVKSALGLQINVSILSSQIESSKQLEELFSKVININYSGRVIKAEWVKEGELMNNKLYFKLRAEVVKESLREDPGFKINLGLNQDLFYVRDDLRNNDEIILRIIPTIDCYINIFIIDSYSDSIQHLFPNKYHTNNFLKGREYFEYPSDIMREQGEKLRVHLPGDRKYSAELICVVATKENISFPSFFEIKLNNIYSASLEDFNKWLAQIPSENRAISYRAYEIRRLK